MATKKAKRGHVWIRGYKRGGKKVKGYWRKKQPPQSKSLAAYLQRFTRFGEDQTNDSPPKPREVIKAMLRRYSGVEKRIKFIYKKKSDLEKATKRIKVWFLCNDPEQGYSIWAVEFGRARALFPAQWYYALNHDTKPHTKKERERLARVDRDTYRAFKAYFEETVLEASNTLHQTEWELVELVGFTNAF